MPNALEQISQETIDLTKQVFADARNGMEKAITVSGEGLVGFNLEAPAKKLYPVLSPFRNRIARTTAPVGSKAANWRNVVGINTANVKAAVAFGTRNASTISYQTLDRAASYKTFGLDDSVEDESVWLGRGFEDVRALSALATLQSVMIEEEKLIVGGNITALGAPTGLAISKTSSDGGTWGGATNYVNVKVVALALYGWLNSKRTDLTQNLADHSVKSANTQIQLAATTDSVTVSGGFLPGAWAYAWFVDEAATNAEPADSAMKLAAITTAPTIKLKAEPASGNAALSNNATDTSADANAFDGLFVQILGVGNTLTTLDSSFSSGVLKKVTGPSTIITGALIYDMNLSGGDGGALTADGAGGITELDAVLKALWDEARIGPTLIAMHSQEALNITKKIGGSDKLGYRVMLEAGEKGFTGGVFVGGYLNKFSSSLTPGNPDVVPFLIHPYMAPGTMVVLSERLPYPNNQVPNVLEMELQQEYADFEWARVQRKYEHGVYANGVLKHYFPAGCALIRGIKNG